MLYSLSIGRDSKIRTYDPLVPNQMRYQAALCPDDYLIGGSCEIRTHGGLQTLAGFQDRCIQPLCQASITQRYSKKSGALGRNRTGTGAMPERF